MRRLRTFFITGLIVLAPVAVTLWITWWLVSFLDGLLAGLASSLTMPLLGRTVPGLGVALTLVIILLAGMIATNFIGRRLIGLGEQLLSRVPFVNAVYNTVKQIVDAVAASNQDAFKRVVLVEYPRRGMWALAFVTGSARGEVQAVTQSEVISVLLPTTPNPTSGFLLMVPKDDVIPLAMSVEDGMKLVISGGVVIPPDRRVTGALNSLRAPGGPAGDATAGAAGQDGPEASGPEKPGA